MKTLPNSHFQVAPSGISLVEMIVTITVVGILAAAAVGVYDRVLETSQATIAQNHVETLNKAVKKYIQLKDSGIRDVPGNSTSSLEEYDILRALQWAHPNTTLRDSGAPYMRPDYDPGLSSSTDEYRAVWNGHFFELKRPGEAGAGIHIVFDGSDLGKTVVFPNNFTPLSSW